jgi:hypothetical protein
VTSVERWEPGQHSFTLIERFERESKPWVRATLVLDGRVAGIGESPAHGPYAETAIGTAATGAQFAFSKVIAELPTVVDPNLETPGHGPGTFKVTVKFPSPAEAEVEVVRR